MLDVHWKQANKVQNENFIWQALLYVKHCWKAIVYPTWFSNLLSVNLK